MIALNSSNRHTRRVLVAAAALLLSTPAALAQSYAISDLGTLGGPTSEAFGVNNFGHVAGVSTVADAHLHAFFRDTAAHEIPPPLGHQSHAFDLNDADQVVATYADLGDVARRGLLWQAGVSTDLGNIAPHGVSNTGVVVGCATTLDATFGYVDRAAMWQSGTLHDLGTLGGHFSYAYAVTDDGRIVGMSFTANDAARRATLWLGGGPLDLGTLGGTNSQAYDVNAAWHVVGAADTVAGEPHAFLFTLGSNGNVLTRTDLGTLGGGYSYAYGINATDVVVGTSNGVAFRWQAGVITDLNTLIATGTGWRLDAARAVNVHGQIAGTGLHHGQPHAFLLTPLQAGDLNCDGVVNFDDINPFIDALSDPAFYHQMYPDCEILNADCNHDGAVNFDDVNPFVALFGG